MKKLILGILVFLTACTTIKYIPIKGETIVKDSIIVETRIDTLKIQLPPEKVRDWTGLLDTLQMDTRYAQSKSWVDTTRGILAGELVTKDTPVEAYVPSTSTTQVRDSIVYRDVPVPVEVVKTVHPKYEKWLWIWSVLSFLGIALFIYKKVLPK